MTRIEAREGMLGPLLSGSKTDRFRQIHSILHRSRISIASLVCGACARMAEDVHRHLRERMVFGKPLASYGQVQARMAEIDAARDISAVLHEVACHEAEAADWPQPSVDVFAASEESGGLPQGLRCLGGRIFANATVLRWCMERGLPRRSVQPLLTRMTRDLMTAGTWREDAGLIDY